MNYNCEVYLSVNGFNEVQAVQTEVVGGYSAEYYLLEQEMFFTHLNTDNGEVVLGVK